MTSESSVHTDRGAARGHLAKLSAPKSLKIYEGIAARTHTIRNPLLYSWGPEHRDATELQRIVDQLPGKPLTLQHPDDLISSGAKAHVIGVVRSARLDTDVDGAYAVVTVEVTDQAGIDAIDGGMVALSAGYTSKLDENRFQRDVTLDHLALVPAARCGQQCQIKADSVDLGADQYRTDLGGLGDSESSDNAESTAKPTCCTQCADRYPDSVVADLHSDKKLNAKEREGIPASHFAVPARKALPIEDKGHVDAAMSRFGEEHFENDAEKQAAFHHIVARAHELGIDASGFEKKHGAMTERADKALTAEEFVMDELKEQLSKALADAAAQKARADKAESDLTVATKRADALELERDEAKRDVKAESARADSAKADADAAIAKAHSDAAGTLDANVAVRVDLLTKANTILGATDDKGVAIDRSKLSNRDLMVEIVKRVDGDDLTEEKRDGWIESTCEGAVKRHTKGRTSRADARVVVEQVRKDGIPVTNPSIGPEAERLARLEYIRAQRG